jgi:hypothetical protein
VVEGSGHTFSNRVGREGVRQVTEGWLSLYFPLPEEEDYARSSCGEIAELQGWRETE